MAVRNDAAERVLRRLLRRDGYSVSRARSQGETGVDLIARRGGERHFIEIIGYSDRGPKRSRDFFEAFFRAVSRLEDGASSCVIALPSEYRRGLRQRATHYGEAWRRIGAAFPELAIWLVDCDPGLFHVQRFTWNHWLADA